MSSEATSCWRCGKAVPAGDSVETRVRIGPSGRGVPWIGLRPLCPGCATRQRRLNVVTGVGVWVFLALFAVGIVVVIAVEIAMGGIPIR